MTSRPSPPSAVRKASSSVNQSEDDHRKRKRNRTSKSCINCRMAKRQCDRQRPACQRCVSLGLTGLCAFEVDDISSPSDPQDENARLRRRIAELERVIRELQRKPHPRWAPSETAKEDGSSKESSKDTALASSSESDADNSGGITLTMPFTGPTIRPPSQTADSSIPSSSTSSRASTPLRSPLTIMQPILRKAPDSSDINHYVGVQNSAIASGSLWGGAFQAPSTTTSTATYGLGYYDHFTPHHVSDVMDLTGYPGGATAFEVNFTSPGPSSQGPTQVDDTATCYPCWQTISLNGHVPHDGSPS